MTKSLNSVTHCQFARDTGGTSTDGDNMIRNPSDSPYFRHLSTQDIHSVGCAPAQVDKPFPHRCIHDKLESQLTSDGLTHADSTMLYPRRYSLPGDHRIRIDDSLGNWLPVELRGRVISSKSGRIILGHMDEHLSAVSTNSTVHPEAMGLKGFGPLAPPAEKKGEMAPDPQKFRDEIIKGIAAAYPNTPGVSFVITQFGKTVVSPFSQGSARGNYETNPVAMTPDSVVHLASASKVITTAAVLKALEDKAIDPSEMVWHLAPWGLAHPTFKKLSYALCLR